MGTEIGEALELGEGNSVRRTTFLRGRRDDNQHEWLGPDAFLHVAPGVGSSIPEGDAEAIIATGLRAGAGVVANGGAEGGAGLEGRGGDGKKDEIAGTGVLGLGGSGRQSGSAVHSRPGAGLLAMGGAHVVKDLTLDDVNAREPDGCGVLAVPAGTDIPNWDESAHVGVFGQGGHELEHKVTVFGGSSTQGSPFPGAGVVGRGGGRRKKTDTSAATVVPGGGAGVVGMSGGSSLPDVTLQRDAGVVGWSDLKETGRAGVFITKETPQLQLAPVGVPFTGNTPTTKGKPGDLLVTTRKIGAEQTAELWFCDKVNHWNRIA
ncbi:hypothetical protein [Streptomyces sp. NBC_01443]|uniref:hypothetical protein n=1 Tax=Streptomyces sp. NBC_01443 TaxID=2903868 RepID=UPI00224D3CF8|nr:hypothetical protein [Streptomyces sp. NBC_01443]MCX4633392.1 hypothetical protein [Streptomyces sp. NBC_01443]